MAIETLLDVYLAGGRLSMRCAWGSREGLKSIRECRFHHEIDILTLMITRGRRCPIVGLANKMRCPACGSPRVAIAISMDGDSVVARNVKLMAGPRAGR